MIKGLGIPDCHQWIQNFCFKKCSLTDAAIATILTISGIALTALACMAATTGASHLLFISLSSGAISSIIAAIYQLMQNQASRSNVKTATDKSQQPSYGRLPTKNEFDHISYIVTSLGSLTLYELRKSQSEIQQLGRELWEIHPLRFLSTALIDKKLKNEMTKLRDRKLGYVDVFVWNQFFKDYSKKLNRQLDCGNLIPYLDKFADDLKLDNANLHSIVKDRRWEDFFNIIF